MWWLWFGYVDAQEWQLGDRRHGYNNKHVVKIGDVVLKKNNADVGWKLEANICLSC